jgi:hypothetical protein
MRAREKNCGNINQEVVQHQISYMKSLKLSFYSYKSPKGKCYMDACAFTANRTGFYCNSEKFNEIACKMQVTPVSEADNCKMKVAAAKAVRTMRIEGTLPTYGSRLGWKEI